MIELSSRAQCVMMMLHFVTWTLLLCSLLIWIERKGNPHERKVLAFSLLTTFAIMMYCLLRTYHEGIPERFPVLPIQDLYGGYWGVLLVFLYPIEATSPGWLKGKNILLLLSPMIAITLILAIVPFEFRTLYSWNDVVTHIKEANVWFRIVILFVIIIPYMILLLFVPYNWRKSNVDVKWIHRYTIGSQGISVLYILFMLTGSQTISFFHLLYHMLFFLYTTYQELYLRLLPVSGKGVAAPDKEETSQAIEPKKEPKSDASELWTRMEEYMREEKPWRSPNLTVGEVAKAIGVSRTKLSTDISVEGNESFHAIVARYRIAEFCKMAQRGEVENVNEALFAVGFRSRSTAYERFKEKLGMTPAEYIKTIKTGET